MKKIGPRTHPCGTPHPTACERDLELPMATNSDLSVRYDSNQHKTVLLSPMEWCSRLISIP